MHLHDVARVSVSYLVPGNVVHRDFGHVDPHRAPPQSAASMIAEDTCREPRAPNFAGSGSVSGAGGRRLDPGRPLAWRLPERPSDVHPVSCVFFNLRESSFVASLFILEPTHTELGLSKFLA